MITRILTLYLSSKHVFGFSCLEVNSFTKYIFFKHSRNFSQSQQYDENQAEIRIIKHTKTKYHVYQVTKKQECLRSKEQESTRQTSN